MQTLWIYLIDYNNEDTGPVIAALEYMLTFSPENMKVDPFTSALSIPAISITVVCNSIEDHDAFSVVYEIEIFINQKDFWHGHCCSLSAKNLFE